MQDVKEIFKERFADQVRFDEPLSKHSTYKIGGPAKVLIMPQTDSDLEEAFRLVKKHALPYFILGGGSNVLLPDEGFDGVVIKPRNKELTIDGSKVTAGAGVVLAKLASESAKAGLTGLEWGIAVPGTVGGAVRGNAGAFGGEVKDTLVQAEVFDGEEVKTFTNEDLQFSYRSSRIKKEGDLIVINATFNLQAADTTITTAKVKELLDTKVTQQPMGEPCAGCLFKNIEVEPGTTNLKPPSTGEPTEVFKNEVPEQFFEKGIVPAGWLIENAGLKGYEMDGIQISSKHANFLVNTGEGTAKAVKAMAKHIKAEVFKKYGVALEEEVQIVE